MPKTSRMSIELILSLRRWRGETGEVVRELGISRVVDDPWMILDLRERFASEDKRNNCSCSDIRDGPEGRGGRGADGGPVGGGFAVLGGVGGI